MVSEVVQSSEFTLLSSISLIKFYQLLTYQSFLIVTVWRLILRILNVLDT